MKTMQFKSFEEYDTWTEKFEGCYEYEMYPVLVDDGWKISADMFTDCKSWKTALRRFEKAFSEKEEIVGWIEGMRESCESGCMKDINGWKPGWTDDPKVVEDWAKEGVYGWEVEAVDDGRWYISVVISGCYAGREKRAGA